jgi:hypothetical protein
VQIIRKDSLLNLTQKKEYNEFQKQVNLLLERTNNNYETQVNYALDTKQKLYFADKIKNELILAGYDAHIIDENSNSFIFIRWKI